MAKLADEFPGRVKVVEPFITALPARLAGKAELVGMHNAMACDVCVMLVDHTQFRNSPPPSGEDQTVIDTRGVWLK